MAKRREALAAALRSGGQLINTYISGRLQSDRQRQEDAAVLARQAANDQLLQRRQHQNNMEEADRQSANSKQVFEQNLTSDAVKNPALAGRAGAVLRNPAISSMRETPQEAGAGIEDALMKAKEMRDLPMEQQITDHMLTGSLHDTSMDDNAPNSASSVALDRLGKWRSLVDSLKAKQGQIQSEDVIKFAGQPHLDPTTHEMIANGPDGSRQVRDFSPEQKGLQEAVTTGANTTATIDAKFGALPKVRAIAEAEHVTDPKALNPSTEGERAAAAQLPEMLNSHQIMSDLEGKGIGLKGGIDMFMNNPLMANTIAGTFMDYSPEHKKYAQASQAFTSFTILNLSGKQASQQESDRIKSFVTANEGDPPEIKAQKQNTRNILISSAQIAAGGARFEAGMKIGQALKNGTLDQKTFSALSLDPEVQRGVAAAFNGGGQPQVPAPGGQQPNQPNLPVYTIGTDGMPVRKGG